MPGITTEKAALHPIKTRPPPPEETRLYSRRLSQELPISDASLDVYYREKSVGIPFLWESQPGTPKIKTREFPIPPLTPPPSFHASPASRKPAGKQHRSNVFLLRLSLRKQPPVSSCLFDSSPLSQRRASCPPRLSCDSRVVVEEQEEDDCESPDSTLCFYGGGRGRSRGCSSSIRRLLLGDLF